MGIRRRTRWKMGKGGTFIITDDLKMFYYRGLREWPHVPGYLTDTCLSAQNNYKSVLDYFRIKY